MAILLAIVIVLLETSIKTKVLIIALLMLLLNVVILTPLAEPEGRAGEPASFRDLAPPTWVI